MSAQATQGAVESEVSFRTEDGWTLHGTLGLPKQAAKPPVVVLLHSFEHARDTFGPYLYPGLSEYIGKRNLATLRFDLRGRGASVGAKPLHAFGPEERSKIALDVRAALDFLSEQSNLEGSIVGIVAEGHSAEAAVMGGHGDRRVRAITLLSGRLSPTAKQRVAEPEAVPLYLIASQEARESFRDLVDAYKATPRKESHFRAHKNLGVGTTMFGVWRFLHAKSPRLEDDIADWLAERLR